MHPHREEEIPEPREAALIFPGLDSYADGNNAYNELIGKYLFC